MILGINKEIAAPYKPYILINNELQIIDEIKKNIFANIIS